MTPVTHSDQLEIVRRSIFDLLRNTSDRCENEQPLETILLVEDSFFGRRFRLGAVYADWILETSEIRIMNQARELVLRVGLRDLIDATLEAEAEETIEMDQAIDNDEKDFAADLSDSHSNELLPSEKKAA